MHEIFIKSVIAENSVLMNEVGFMLKSGTAWKSMGFKMVQEMKQHSVA